MTPPPHPTEIFFGPASGHADILQFADTLLAPLFGTSTRGLATLTRLTRAFRQWRERVELCPHCQIYVQIDPPAPAGHNARFPTRYAQHSPPGHTDRLCTASKRATVWLGAELDTEITDAAIRLFGTANPNSKPERNP